MERGDALLPEGRRNSKTVARNQGDAASEFRVTIDCVKRCAEEHVSLGQAHAELEKGRRKWKTDLCCRRTCRQESRQRAPFLPTNRSSPISTLTVTFRNSMSITGLCAGIAGNVKPGRQVSRSGITRLPKAIFGRLRCGAEVAAREGRATTNLGAPAVTKGLTGPTGKNDGSVRIPRDSPKRYSAR